LKAVVRRASRDPQASVKVEVWRDGKGVTKQLRPGKLGAILADEPAPEAVLARRQSDRVLNGRGPAGSDWPPLPGTRAEKGRPALPLLPPPEEKPAEKDAPPDAHPFSWAAFVLVGDPG
jgi:CHAT domain-containing protein